MWAKLAEREVPQPRVFVVADVVLDASAAAVVTLELGDRAGLVGEDRLEAVSLVVGEGQLRAGVRALAPDDHPRATAASWLRSRCSVISQTCPFGRPCPS